MTPQTAVSTARPDRPALILLFVGAILIGFAPIFVRVSEIGPTATGFNRFLLALPFLWTWYLTPIGRDRGTARPAGRPTTRGDYAGLALAGLFFAGDMGFWHWSIVHTSVANATLLANTAPVYIVLIGWVLFGTRVTPLFLVGMVTAMAGTAILMRSSLTLNPAHLTGDLLGLVTGMFYGLYFLTVERLRARLSTATIMAHAISISMVILLFASMIAGEDLFATTWRGWLILLGLAVVTQVIGQSLIAYGLAQLPASFTSVSLLLQPLTATVLAWAMLSEAISPVQGLGAVAILIGILLARRGTPRLIAKGDRT